MLRCNFWCAEGTVWELKIEPGSAACMESTLFAILSLQFLHFKYISNCLHIAIKLITEAILKCLYIKILIPLTCSEFGENDLGKCRMVGLWNWAILLHRWQNGDMDSAYQPGNCIRIYCINVEKLPAEVDLKSWWHLNCVLQNDKIRNIPILSHTAEVVRCFVVIFPSVSERSRSWLLKGVYVRKYVWSPDTHCGWMCPSPCLLGEVLSTRTLASREPY